MHLQMQWSRKSIEICINKPFTNEYSFTKFNVRAVWINPNKRVRPMLNGVFVCPRRDVWGLVFMFARCIAYITSPHTSHLVRSSVQFTVSCVRSAATYVKCTRILEPIQGLARYRVRFVTFSRGTSPHLSSQDLWCFVVFLTSTVSTFSIQLS